MQITLIGAALSTAAEMSPDAQIGGSCRHLWCDSV
jgi:hypothetical protein